MESKFSEFVLVSNHLLSLVKTTVATFVMRCTGTLLIVVKDAGTTTISTALGAMNLPVPVDARDVK